MPASAIRMHALYLTDARNSIAMARGLTDPAAARAHLSLARQQIAWAADVRMCCQVYP